MTDPEKPSTEDQRSRRNLIAIGAIAASAIVAHLATIGSATAPDTRNDQGNQNGQGNQDAQGNQDRNLPCFLKGTVIQTVDGNKKIEDLAVGDLLPTGFGGICPIQWIGRYLFKKSDSTKAWVKDVLPVRVARSAFGPDVPHADLYVTKAHSLLIDGVLVPAGSLINGTTITLWDARGRDELEFFHIKLARHDVICAEGAPCETLLDVDERAVNFAEYFRQYGPPPAREARCAPLLDYFGRRNQIKSRFRSAMSPWLDRRQKFDIIRDRLEERGIALLQRSELMT
ncbi:MAG TPA: Hint domain-containing protein [Stellaceae bacterium]|nr:Hint domain-containing protein [Stellaceae bacterium]